MTSAPESPAAPPGARIEIRNLTKQFGSFTAVDDLSFTVEPGRITGFLGPNGAGKTTTLRMALGLIQPTSGTATIGGVAYRHIPHPITMVGAALEATDFHPGRSGRNHLRVLAATAGIPDDRVDEMLTLVGLEAAGRKAAGGYSMGMRQRLGLAAALLGDPEVLLLDEPANGLDPEGIRWLRGLLRGLSGQGKAILISSHLLQEVEQTVDEVVIINNGKLVTAGPVHQLHGEATCVVRTSDPTALARALHSSAGLTSRPDESGALLVSTGDLKLVGDVALAHALPIWELHGAGGDLEDLFFSLTEGTNRNLGPAGPARDAQTGGTQ